MSNTPQSRRSSDILRLCAALFVALAAAGLIQAQVATQGTVQMAAPASTVPSPAGPGVPSGLLWNTGATFDSVQSARRDAILGLAEWDHTLLGAFQLGARLLHLSAASWASNLPSDAYRPATGAARFSVSGSSSHLSLDQIAKALRMDQLQRQGMNLNMNSAYGSFRLQYREVFGGRTNGLGGGVGQASAAASYTTPRFGANGLMNFSAVALMGSGSINSLLGSGFGSSNIGGNGPGHKSQTAPTVAIKLTF